MTPWRFLAFGDEVTGIFEVVQNAGCVGPLPEEVIGLEEMIVSKSGVRHDQRLHGHGVFLHAIADAWIGIDNDFVGEPHLALAVVALVGNEVLAKGPVPVHQRHADRRIGVQHLFGRDDLDLVGVEIQPEIVPRNHLDGIVNIAKRIEGPVGAFEQRSEFLLTCCSSHDTAYPLPTSASFLANNSRKTG